MHACLDITCGPARCACLLLEGCAGCPAGPNYPQRIIAMADWGMSANATSTLQHALVSASAPNVGPPVLYYIADYCYAGEVLALCVAFL